MMRPYVVVIRGMMLYGGTEPDHTTANGIGYTNHTCNQPLGLWPRKMPVGIHRNLSAFASYIRMAVLSTHEDRRHPGDNTRSAIFFKNTLMSVKIMALPNKLAYTGILAYTCTKYWFLELMEQKRLCPTEHSQHAK